MTEDKHKKAAIMTEVTIKLVILSLGVFLRCFYKTVILHNKNKISKYDRSFKHIVYLTAH